MTPEQYDGISRVRTALFVDFDNIYINLYQQDSLVASQFATMPDKWLAWIEEQMPRSYIDAGAGPRRTLIRKCYLNPQTFASYRPYFIRSAFEVVDCPPLTTRGKTSTDIHLVMDVMDALNHETFFHEFIILSGDADFTPLLLRMRKHDRCSAVLSCGYVSPAYKAACDFLIPQDTFIRSALGINLSEDEPGNPPSPREVAGVPPFVLARMSTRLFEVASVPNGIQASELPAVYKEFPEFRQSNHWLGFYSLRRLTEALVAQRNDLVIVEEDPWRVAQKQATPAVTVQPVSSPVEMVEVAVKSPKPDLRAEISTWLRRTVESSSMPVPMATLAQGLIQSFGESLSASDWLGAGTFKNLLSDLDLGSLAISLAIPGYVYDPRCHEAPKAVQRDDDITYEQDPQTERVDEFASRYAGLAALAKTIHQLTDTPYLMPEHYALLLEELAREINDRGYQLTRTSKTVRDRCVEKGAPIARSHVNFVLTGLYYTGHRFGHEPEDAAKLADALVQNTYNLCRAAQLSLSEGEMAQVREWIAGSLLVGVEAV